jgi:hypothetical protein
MGTRTPLPLCQSQIEKVKLLTLRRGWAGISTQSCPRNSRALPFMPSVQRAPWMMPWWPLPDLSRKVSPTPGSKSQEAMAPPTAGRAWRDETPAETAARTAARVIPRVFFMA